MRILFALIFLAFVTACSHPLEIVGEGDIVSSTGTNDCSLEEQPCDNYVTGNYKVTYTAVPRSGWDFTGWQGCGTQFPDCSVDVPGSVIDQYWGRTMPSLTAIFQQELAQSLAQQAYLKASDAAAGDMFGAAISRYEDTLVIGAPGRGIFGTQSPPFNSNYPDAYTGFFRNAGSAYVFAYSGGMWIQQAYLMASNAEGSFCFAGGCSSGDQFGASVAISGATLAIGAPGEQSVVSGDESDNSAREAGAVYVFTLSGGTWIQQAYIKASNAEGMDVFGTSVALSGDTLIVGAPVGGGSNGGVVYIYTRTNGDWIQKTYIEASNAEGGDLFGTSVALSGDTLIVGAPHSRASGRESYYRTIGAGAAYVFTRVSGVWTQQEYLRASNADGDYSLVDGDRFGASVAVSRDTLAIGAPNEDSSADGGENDNSAPNAGAAYVFTRSGSTWTQQTYIKASNADSVRAFGTSVALSGDTLVVGAPYPSIGGDAEYFLGAAYVFTSNNGSWNQATYIEASNADANDIFGTALALHQNTLTVGAPGESSSANGGETDNSAREAGAVYVFQ